jgi:hypothetical protein
LPAHRRVARLFHGRALKFLNEASWDRLTAHRQCGAAPSTGGKMTLGPHRAHCKGLTSCFQADVGAVVRPRQTSPALAARTRCSAARNASAWIVMVG